MVFNNVLKLLLVYNNNYVGTVFSFQKPNLDFQITDACRLFIKNSRNWDKVNCLQSTHTHRINISLNLADLRQRRIVQETLI